jgi:hypothetical protein
VTDLAESIAGDVLLWRVTLTEFARWWRWRNERRWAVLARSDGRFEVQFEEWRPEFPLGLEIVRGRHVATVPVTGPRMTLCLEDLAYEHGRAGAAIPVPAPAPRRASWKSVVRAALDWETVTPLEDLPSDTLSARVKKELRRWRGGHPHPLEARR